MSVPFLSSLAIQAQEEGRSVGTLLERLPRDPASIFVLFLVLGAVVLIWWGGKPRG